MQALFCVCEQETDNAHTGDLSPRYSYLYITAITNLSQLVSTLFCMCVVCTLCGFFYVCLCVSLLCVLCERLRCMCVGL